jgi:hypothetical protein
MAALVNLPAAIVAGFAAYFFCIRNIHGWTFLPFGDEAGHLLGAIALHAGDRLYSSYIDAHGPVVFMLTQLYGALSGWHDMTYARLVSTALAALAGLAVLLSPAQHSSVQRLWSVALFFGVTASVWLLQALYMDSYHTIAGALMVIGLALFAAPSWLGLVVPPPLAFLSGMCFAFVGFTGYSYAPAATLLALSGLVPLIGDRQAGRFFRATGALALGGAAATAVMLLWLVVYGDIVGFIVFHIIMNEVDYARYIGFTFANFVHSFIPPITPATIVHLIGLTCFGAAFVANVGMALTAGGRPVRPLFAIVLGFTAIALLNARGSTIFQDGSFVMTAIGAAAIAVPQLLARLGLAATVWRSLLASGLVAAGVAGAEFAGRHAVASPTPYTRAQMNAAPPFHYGVQQSALFDEIRRIVKPDQRLLVLVYDPMFFLSVGRLPMAKYHEYLPWDADYAKAPWFGHERDLCVDLARSPPPAVYFDDWKVWDAFAPEDYMPCVLRVLATHYDQSGQFPKLYVRMDIAAH